MTGETLKTLLKMYDEYYDNMERANRIPLSFDAWCKSKREAEFILALKELDKKPEH